MKRCHDLRALADGCGGRFTDPDRISPMANTPGGLFQQLTALGALRAS
jgi:hypothetical protein